MPTLPADMAALLEPWLALGPRQDGRQPPPIPARRRFGAAPHASAGSAGLLRREAPRRRRSCSRRVFAADRRVKTVTGEAGLRVASAAAAGAPRAVVIDPPFEATDEFADVLDTSGSRRTQAFRRRRPTSSGIPSKARRAVDSFARKLAALPAAEHIAGSEIGLDRHERIEWFNGCGVVNLRIRPGNSTRVVGDRRQISHRSLAREGDGTYRVEWLKFE